jgi:hypothetical protein
MEPRSARLLQRWSRIRRPMKLIELAIASQSGHVMMIIHWISTLGRPIPTREALYSRDWTRIEENERPAVSSLISVAYWGTFTTIRFHDGSFRELNSQSAHVRGLSNEITLLPTHRPVADIAFSSLVDVRCGWFFFDL